MAVFGVNGNEILWLYQVQDKFWFFLAGVAGDVNGAAGVVVIDERAATEHVVEHAENGFFVSGNDAGREDDAVVFVDGDEAMIVDRDAGKRGHGLGLAAAGENDQAFGVEAANVLRADDHAGGDGEEFGRMGDFALWSHVS